MLNMRSHFMGGFGKVAGSLGCPEQFVRAVLQVRELQESPEFGGGLGAVRTELYT